MAEPFAEDVTVERPEQARPRDLVSLVFGLLFAGLAGSYFVADLTDLQLELRWVAPAVLITGGLLGLLASVVRAKRARTLPDREAPR